ncbi:MAG: hypothetical protein FWD76_04900, partial [Firmicutes bacterium]|nr:hypothetical protein [Bacillota bacterium]
MDANHQDATNPEIALQNPFDTAPLTTAQNLKKQVGTTLATLCMGTNDIAYTTACLQQITHLYDIDHTYLLHDPFLAGSDTLATAYALSATSKFLGDFDLYLCGAQSSDGATGQVGIEIAAHLGLSVLCNVCKIEVIDAQKIKCTVLSQFGRYVFVATLPCVLCMVGTKGSSNVQPINVTQYTDTPPFAGTLLTALQANLDLSKIGLQGSPTQIKSTSKIESAQKNEFKLTSLQPKKAIDITQEYLTILPQILQKTKQERTTILKHNHHRPTRKISHSDSVWIFCEQVCNHIIPECYQIISKACQLAKPHGGEVIALCSHKPLKQDRALLSEYGVDRCLHGDFEKHTDCLFDQKMVDWFVDLCK